MGESMGRFRKQSPGEGKTTLATWSCIKLDEGEGMNLWKIGPTLWFWSHFVNSRTVPCHHEFTDGNIQCHRCGTRDYWQGYTPCYDEAGARLLALPKESNKPIDDRIKPGAAVFVSRKRGKQKPQTIVPKPWAKDWILTDRDHAALADLEQCLILIWKDEKLAEWFRQCGGPTVTLRQQIDKTTESVAEADEDAKKLRALISGSLKVRPAASVSDGPVSLGDALPGVNGRHHKKV